MEAEMNNPGKRNTVSIEIWEKKTTDRWKRAFYLNLFILIMYTLNQHFICQMPLYLVCFIFRLSSNHMTLDESLQWNNLIETQGNGNPKIWDEHHWWDSCFLLSTASVSDRTWNTNVHPAGSLWISKETI